MMDIEDSYQQTLDYLYSYVDYSLTKQWVYSPEKFNLDRVRLLLERLGDPHRAYPVVHITGTKGKGSVSALTAAALQASGLKVGLYTSPHLLDYCERIAVDGIPVTHARLVGLVDRCRAEIERIPELTTFEITTALGFLYFREQAVDVAVVEVGLGGRLDATNVVDPAVSVITAISYDHQAVLGKTLVEIAREKAGIIKKDRPVVIAPQAEEALDVLIRAAAEVGSTVTLVGRDLLYRPRGYSLEQQDFELWPASDQAQMDRYLEGGETPGWEPLRLSLPLLGDHQLDNAATALAVLEKLRQGDLRIRMDGIRSGFARVRWSCRFEIVRGEPLVVLDSAHNRDSALKLRLTLQKYLPGRPCVLLFGASEDKDVAGMLHELRGGVERVIATESVHPRAMPAGTIVQLAHQAGLPAQTIVPLETAFAEARRAAQPGSVILVAGSIFLAAAVKGLLMQEQPMERQD